MSMRSVRIDNLDGMERLIASIRELPTTKFVELLKEDHVTEKDLTDDALRKAIKDRSSEDKGEGMDPGLFKRRVTRADGRDMSLPVFTRIYAAGLALKRFLKKGHLELKYATGWNDRNGRLIVEAITRDLQLLTDVRRLKRG